MSKSGSADYTTSSGSRGDACVRRSLVGGAIRGSRVPLEKFRCPGLHQRDSNRAWGGCRRAVAEGSTPLRSATYSSACSRIPRARLAGSGLTPLFPLWELRCGLAREMIRPVCVRGSLAWIRGFSTAVRRAGVRPRTAGGLRSASTPAAKTASSTHFLRWADVFARRSVSRPAKSAKSMGLSTRTCCPAARYHELGTGADCVSGHPGAVLRSWRASVRCGSGSSC